MTTKCMQIVICRSTLDELKTCVYMYWNSCITQIKIFFFHNCVALVRILLVHWRHLVLVVWKFSSSPEKFPVQILLRKSRYHKHRHLLKIHIAVFWNNNAKPFIKPQAIFKQGKRDWISLFAFKIILCTQLRTWYYYSIFKYWHIIPLIRL